MPGTNITEYAGGGPISLFPSPATSLNLPIQETPTVPWDDPSTWINVQDYGAIPGDGQDDAPAVQAAIDAATATNRTIYFPKDPSNQPYQFGGTVVVRGHVQRIVGNYANMMLLSSFASQSQPLFRLVDGTEAEESSKDGLLVFDQVWFQWAEAVARKPTFFVNERSGKTLVRNSFFSHGRLYDGTAATGTTFFDDTMVSVQPGGDTSQPLPGLIIGPNETFFGRQLNPETRGGHIRNDGGDLWVLGFKTEQYDSDFKTAPHIHTRSGGQTEILGGFMHAMHGGNGGIDADAPPVFIIENARVSFTGLENATNDQSYPITVREIRSGVTRDLPLLQSPLNGTAATNNLSFKLPLYVGYSGSGNQAPTLQLLSPAGGNATIRGERLSIVAEADDDGQPGPLALNWERVSGPSGVVFHSPASASTDVTFPGDGEYHLRLTAFDGELGRSLEVHVAVNSAPPIAPTDGLFLRYDLDQSSGATVVDSSGSGNDGSIVNLAQGEWLPEGGVIDGAYRIKTVPLFNWLNGRIVVPNTIPATPKQSIAAWVRQDFDSTRSTLYIGQINGLAIGFNHDYNFCVVRVYFGEPDSGSLNHRVYTANFSLPPKGSWFHLAATYDSTSGEPPILYLNGIARTFNSAVAGTTGGRPYLETSSVVSSIAGALSQQPTEGMHDGSLDQFLAYNRSLTAAEIDTIYQSNIGNLGPLVDLGPDLAAESGDTLLLAGTITDDGLPINPGTLSYAWSKLSGPAGPTRNATNVATPEVTFLNAGTYTLRLAVSDGLVTSFDTVTVTVSGENVQLAPEASDVFTEGLPALGEVLSVSYSYFDANGDPEDTAATAFRWLRADLPDGPFFAISGATEESYTPTAADYGKYLRAEVTPAATIEPFVGDPALSPPLGPVLTTPLIAPPVTDGLIAFWTFDERTSPAVDRSPNGYHATLQSGAGFAPDGRYASALAPGAGQGATASPMAGPTQDFTLTAWVRHNNYSTNTNEIILGKGWDTFALYVATGTNNGQLRIQFKDTTNAQFNANYDNARDWIPAGQWTHLAAIREGSTFRLYVNGLLRTPTWTNGAGTQPIQSNFSALSLGGMPFAAHWDGLLDQVGLYSRALTESEIIETMEFNPALYDSTQAEATGYSAWAETAFGSLQGGAGHPDAAAGADPDGDGMVNLLEYALGGAPLQPDTGLWPVASLQELAGENYLQLEFTPANLEGLRFFIEASNDLNTWSRTEITNSLTPGQTYIHIDPQTVDALTSPQRFIRLLIEML